MSLLSKVKTGKLKEPVLVLIHGVEGVGKTTFGAEAPNSIILGPEKGSSWLDVARFPEVRSFQEARDAIKELTMERHDYQSLVIDSLDWLEPLVERAVCDLDGSESIEKAQGGFGKGYVACKTMWRGLMNDLSDLRAKRGMNIIVVAHSVVKAHSDPRTNAQYDRYVMRLNDKSAQVWKEFVDTVLFATFEVHTKKQATGDKSKAFSTGNRVMFTNWSAAYDAKNRVGLPNEMPLSWDSFFEAYNKAQPESPVVLDEQARQLLARVPDEELKLKVTQSLEKFSGDATQLAKIVNKLRTIVGEV